MSLDLEAADFNNRALHDLAALAEQRLPAPSMSPDPQEQTPSPLPNGSVILADNVERPVLLVDIEGREEVGINNTVF